MTHAQNEGQKGWGEGLRGSTLPGFHGTKVLRRVRWRERMAKRRLLGMSKKTPRVDSRWGWEDLCE